MVIYMLPQKLKDLRAVKSISQSTLADVLGVTQQAVAKWETEKAEPDSKTLKKIANYFGVSIDYLLDNEPQTTPTLSADEFELLAEFKKLPIECQRDLFDYIDYLKYKFQKKK